MASKKFNKDLLFMTSQHDDIDILRELLQTLSLIYVVVMPY